nr:MAG TPA: hypothetical protein [Caudoviricetes sp.]
MRQNLRHRYLSGQLSSLLLTLPFFYVLILLSHKSAAVPSIHIDDVIVIHLVIPPLSGTLPQ